MAASHREGVLIIRSGLRKNRSACFRPCAAQGAADLSGMRYRGGAASYLEVLTNETNYFAAQLNLARARLNERLSLVQIYTALGGGWEQ